MYHFPSRSMIAVNSLWSVCFDMYLSYRGRDPGTSSEASDREGHESKIADRRARTMPIDTRRTTILKNVNLTVSSINGVDNRVNLPVARSSSAGGHKLGLEQACQTASSAGISSIWCS